MASMRDPYPFPKYQNDDNFRGPRYTQPEPYPLTTGASQQQHPWQRLSAAATLSSARREVFHHDPQAPRDSLDFTLKSQYDHHKEFLKGANETLLQKETLGLHHGRVLKNRSIHVPPEVPDLNHPLRVADAPTKESIHSCKKAIEGHHTQTTNRGYSRKPDGGYFTS